MHQCFFSDWESTSAPSRRLRPAEVLTTTPRHHSSSLPFQAKYDTWHVQGDVLNSDDCRVWGMGLGSGLPCIPIPDAAQKHKDGRRSDS